MILRRVIEHIRKQEWTAVALDFVIVVMGVFIGIQVSNWNAARAEQAQIRAYMLALKEDLASDREMLSVVAEQINDTIQDADVISDYSRGRALEDFDNLELFLLIPWGGYRPYSWNRTTFAQLSATGGGPKIRDPRLRAMVADYEAKTEHLDIDFESDERHFNALRELSNHVIDRNYPNRTDLYELSYVPLDEARASEAFRIAQEMRLPVVAENVRQIQQVISSILIIQEALAPRVEREIPELIELGASISERIDQEYGD